MIQRFLKNELLALKLVTTELVKSFNV